MFVLGLAGCNGEVEVGYQPPIVVPVRVSINSRGDINLGFSEAIVTPLGIFDISAGSDIYSLRQQYTGRVLVVRVDDQVAVYELEEGKEFKINFEDDNKLYKKVALEYESDGDIVLELESVRTALKEPASGGSSNSSPSCPGAEPQQVQVGDAVNVCTQSDNLIVRKKPSLGAAEIFRIAPGTSAYIVDGPTCADNSSWWKIEVPSGTSVRRGSYDAPLYSLDADTTGWVREGSDEIDRYFICPR